FCSFCDRSALTCRVCLGRWGSRPRHSRVGDPPCRLRREARGTTVRSRPQHRTRGAVALAALLAPVLLVGVAVADDTPSAEQVAAAERAAEQAGRGVAGVRAELALVGHRLDEAEVVAAQADEAANRA